MPVGVDDVTRRNTFNSEAELYHEARPHYPAELFEALIEVTQLPEGAHLLEIGPGTGQATAPLAERGYQITAVEVGEALAEVARRELRRYPNVEVITAAFEDVDLCANSFDLVYAATAIHWVRPEARYLKPHRLLKSDGHMAVVHTNHVRGDPEESFFRASQPIYKKYGDNPPKAAKDSKPFLFRMKDLKAEPMHETLFEVVFFRVFPLSVRYSADAYIKLLRTFSPTLAMDAGRREHFLREIHDLIAEDFGGCVTKHHGMSLTIGRKKLR